MEWLRTHGSPQILKNYLKLNGYGLMDWSKPGLYSVRLSEDLSALELRMLGIPKDCIELMQREMYQKLIEGAYEIELPSQVYPGYDFTGNRISVTGRRESRPQLHNSTKL